MTSTRRKQTVKWSRARPGIYQAEYEACEIRIVQTVSGRWEITGVAVRPEGWVREHYTLRAAKDHVVYILVTRPAMLAQMGR